MSWQELFHREDVRNIARRYGKVSKQIRMQEDLAFNVFSIVSDAHLHECCHSKILSAMLNRREPEVGQVFARLFVCYLNSVAQDGQRVNPYDFDCCNVTTELDKMDICLWGKHKKAIIVENKINSARDQDRQIPRYLHSVTDKDYDAAMVVYITRDSGKGPSSRNGWTEQECKDVDRLLVPISAYNDSCRDLVSGWLRPCLKNARSKDAEVLIQHYIDILRHQGSGYMMDSITNKFAGLLKQEPEIYELAQSISAMLEELPKVLGQRIAQGIGDCKPFGQALPGYDGFCMIWDQLWYTSPSGQCSHLALRIMLRPPHYVVQFVDQEPSPQLESVKSVLAGAALQLKASCPDPRGFETAFDFTENGEREMTEFIRGAINGLYNYSKQDEVCKQFSTW